jgi:hypothetical protein
MAIIQDIQCELEMHRDQNAADVTEQRAFGSREMQEGGAGSASNLRGNLQTKGEAKDSEVLDSRGSRVVEP